MHLGGGGPPLGTLGEMPPWPRLARSYTSWPRRPAAMPLAKAAPHLRSSQCRFRSYTPRR